MKPSEAIRRLLRRFPGLKPAAIRRVLAARGYVVDTNLIVVTRHRDLERKRELAVGRVIGELGERRPDLSLAVRGDEAISGLVAGLIANNPGLKPAEHAALLEAEIVKEVVPVKFDRDAERRARLYAKVLDQHPEFRRATELTFGAVEVVRAVPNAPGIETWPDEVLEAAILVWLQQQFPPADTVDGIALTVLAVADQRKASQDLNRVESILAKVTEEAGAEPPDREAALRAIRAYIEQHPDQSDQQIVDGMLLGRDRDPEELRENYREIEFEIDSKKRVAGVRFTGDRDRLKFTKYKGRSF